MSEAGMGKLITGLKHCIAIGMLIGFSLSAAYSAHADEMPSRVDNVRDVENPARTPFVVQGEVKFEDEKILTELGEVPSGKRAIIEFISMVCQTIPPDTIIFVLFTFPHENGSAQYLLPISKQGDPGNSIFQSWVAGQLVRIYADEGPIFIQVGRSSPPDEERSGCQVSISGHTIDVDVN
jgi:hypothetical protein